MQAPGFTPINLGIFWLCVKPPISDTCSAGEIDCDGGNALGLGIHAARNVGACIGNADCAVTCAAFCAPSGVLEAGCEGFCTDGAQSACVADADCAGLGEGSCNGPDGVALGNVCDCTCLDTAADGASSAGDLGCQLAFNLTLENIPGNGLACDGADVAVDLGDTCGPLSTQSLFSILENANNSGVSLPPGGFLDAGTAFDCANLPTGITSGADLVGSLPLFGTPLGDINLQLVASCL